jgi:three-Cys-motif partner protein
MVQKSFATKGTQKKLKTLHDYLTFYTNALSGKFELTYFDGFAGSGAIPHGDALPLFDNQEDFAEVIEGSARRALDLAKPFDHYVFVDSKKAYANSLELLRDEFPSLANRIRVVHGDANWAVNEFCTEQFRPNSKDRAIIFLDPFGNNVDWATLEVIAQTPGIDLWYLFPSGLGVTRQMSEDGTVQKDAKVSLDRMFGTSDWEKHLVVKELAGDLFDENLEVTRKVATADSVTRYMIGRMQTIFPSRVLDRWLPLGRQGGHWYSLLFAWSNPSPAATNLASRVAREIMRRS